MKDLTYITIALSLVFIILSISMIPFKVINDRKVKKICELYEKKFNYLPLDVKIFKDSTWYTLPYHNGLKKQFIIRPLLKGKKSHFSKNESDVEFMKGLPSKLTRSFIIEVYMGRAAGVLVILMLALMWIDKNI